MTESASGRIALVLLLAVLVLAAASRPESGPAPSSASAGADRLLERAVVALGGREAMARAGRIQFTHEGTARSVEQARDPSLPATESPRRSRYLIDLDRRRLRLETSTIFPGELELSTLIVLDGPSGFSLDLAGWRIGTDITRIPEVATVASFDAGTRILPHLLLLQVTRYDSTVVDAGVQEVEGERYRVLSYRDVSGAAIGVYLDPATWLVRGYEVRRGAASNLVLWEDYRLAAGVQIPRRSRSFANGEPSEDVRITSLALHATVPDSLVRIPPGYSDPPPAVDPHVAGIGDGVYVLHGMPNDYRSMFVDMGDHVIVAEAPVSPAYGEAALRLIEQTLPGKPVRYVLVTHHHGDHTGAIAPFVERGAVIVAGQGADLALRRQHAALGERLRIETVTTSRTFGGGARRIDVHPVPNPHADGSLVFHLPAQRTLFQGDLLYVPWRGPVPAAFPAAEPLAHLIRSRALDVGTIVGVHGRIATVADLEEAVRLRARQ